MTVPGTILCAFIDKVLTANGHRFYNKFMLNCLKSPADKLIHETPAYLVCKAKLISTSSTGTFWAAPTVAVGFAAMVSATSIPFTTRPNTA